jgi:ribosomal silencing factor RsfS
LTKLERILHTLDDKKATNIVVMDLSDVELIHDKMVIPSVKDAVANPLLFDFDCSLYT